ncbi:hypothetical protein HK405_009702, partial [Cladochytrium tenue]
MKAPPTSSHQNSRKRPRSSPSSGLAEEVARKRQNPSRESEVDPTPVPLEFIRTGEGLVEAGPIEEQTIYSSEPLGSASDLNGAHIPELAIQTHQQIAEPAGQEGHRLASGSTSGPTRDPGPHLDNGGGGMVLEIPNLNVTATEVNVIHTIDKKTVMRTANSLASQGLLKILDVQLPHLNGSMSRKTLLLHKDLNPDDEMVTRRVAELGQKQFLGRVHDRGNRLAPTEGLEVERLHDLKRRFQPGIASTSDVPVSQPTEDSDFAGTEIPLELFTQVISQSTQCYELEEFMRSGDLSVPIGKIPISLRVAMDIQLHRTKNCIAMALGVMQQLHLVQITPSQDYNIERAVDIFQLIEVVPLHDCRKAAYPVMQTFNVYDATGLHGNWRTAIRLPDEQKAILEHHADRKARWTPLGNNARLAIVVAEAQLSLPKVRQYYQKMEYDFQRHADSGLVRTRSRPRRTGLGTDDPRQQAAQAKGRKRVKDLLSAPSRTGDDVPNPLIERVARTELKRRSRKSWTDEQDLMIIL